MALVTYIDHEEAAPRVEFMGVKFRDGIPVPLEDNQYADLLDTLDGNRFFQIEREEPPVEEAGEPEADDMSRYREAGAQAYRDGKELSIPPRWRKGKSGEAWAAGFKREKAKIEAVRDATNNA